MAGSEDRPQRHWLGETEHQGSGHRPPGHFPFLVLVPRGWGEKALLRVPRLHLPPPALWNMLTVCAETSLFLKSHTLSGRP